MDLQSLNIFIQVAELNSFTKAGETLGYSQPTVSFQIKQLEKELGVQLFDRIGHTISLTEAGREVLSYAQQIYQISNDMLAVDKNKKDIGGTVRIAMADSLCSPLIMEGFATFKAEYPNISLNVKTAGTGDLYNLLDHNEADFVCTMDTPIHNAQYRIVNEEKIAVNFVVSKENPLADKAKVTVQDLLGQSFILTEKGMSYRRLLDEEMAKNSLEINPVLEMGNADIICQLVAKNLGISFLPDYVTEKAVKGGEIIRIKVENFNVSVWNQLIYHRDKWVSAPMKAVMAHLSKISLI